MRLTLIIFLLLFSALAYAQPSGQLQELLSEGKSQVHAGEYEQANLTFRKILTLNQTIPSEFCYYFATTLYHIGQYRNSKSFIDKYYELSGNSGDYTTQITQLNEVVDNELEKINNCRLCDNNGYVLTACHSCNGIGEQIKNCHICKSKGSIKCDACGGSGVMVRKNLFNVSEYLTCGKCEGEGTIICPTCEGTKEISSICPTCKGKGALPTSEICNHPNDHQ